MINIFRANILIIVFCPHVGHNIKHQAVFKCGPILGYSTGPKQRRDVTIRHGQWTVERLTGFDAVQKVRSLDAAS